MRSDHRLNPASSQRKCSVAFSESLEASALTLSPSRGAAAGAGFRPVRERLKPSLRTVTPASASSWMARPTTSPKPESSGGASYDPHPGSCWTPVPGMRLGMNWPATRATYIGAAGARQRHSGRIRRACALVSAGASWGSLALRMALPIWKRLDVIGSARYGKTAKVRKTGTGATWRSWGAVLPFHRYASTGDFVLTRAAGLE